MASPPHNRPETLAVYLQQNGPRKAAELLQALGISQPTLNRWVKSRPDLIQSAGARRGAIYFAPRDLRGEGHRFPMIEVNEVGEETRVGEVLSAHPRGYLFLRDSGGAPQVFDGLPSFIADVRPQGFMGRSFPLKHPDLRLPDRVTDWGNDDIAVAVTRRGEDVPGNLVIGKESIERYLASPREPRAISLSQRAMAYETAAEESLRGQRAGSSAGGEHPKFSAMVRLDQKANGGNAYRPVLVKFSPRIRTEEGARWADLLAAEHEALHLLSEKGHAAVVSEIIRGKDRVFLEVTRFDRMGARGRQGLISLGAIDDERYGRRDDWVSASERLLRDRAISKIEASEMRFLHAFGGLIGNSDRHFGNLSFYCSAATGKIRLAPIYDMLPMMYAPINGQIIERKFEIETPQALSIEEWKQALPLAIEYWRRLAEHAEISMAFRGIAEANAETLRLGSRRSL